MPSDYSAIREENVRRFGTDIPRIGKMLLAERYDDRTHFIYELLQNAEDAMARRHNWSGKRSAAFHLTGSEVTFTHFGIPFNEQDVRGICGIGESTKQIGAIGRFGIGFKSVCAFTDSPEIHSGSEHFAIDSFVWPRAVPAMTGEGDQTLLVLPLRSNDSAATDDITGGLRRLGLRALLFLRELEEIEWSVEGGGYGLYVRGRRQRHAGILEEVELVEEIDGLTSDVERWLIFSKEVSLGSPTAGYIEIAFRSRSTASSRLQIEPVPDAVLSAFFPTIVPTNLGFLLQGPYQTTPSRDNVLRHAPINERLVEETAQLLRVALRTLRDMHVLDVAALNTLPLDRSKFADTNMFAPIFEAVLAGFVEDDLLPRFGGGYITASVARLARSQDLRDLVSSKQLTALLESQQELSWLTEDITADREPELRAYLMNELHVPELTWETLLANLTTSFFEAQPPEWIVRLYEALNGLPALIRSGRLDRIPLIRLEEGTHVAPRVDDQPQAFLPGAGPSGFPTVSRAVLSTEEAKSFLKALGLTEPDPVDDVILHVLPRYASSSTSRPPSYDADVRQVLAAYATDSKSRREALIDALEATSFVAAVDAGDGQRKMARPKDVYIATERLQELFKGVSGVLLVDDSEESLRGEAARDLLTAAGVSRYLSHVPVDPNFDPGQLAQMRKAAGMASSSGYEQIADYTIRGLDRVLGLIGQLDAVAAASRAKVLWDSLDDLDSRAGASAFAGTYKWSYHVWHTYDFDASFIRTLNKRAWVPDAENNLRPPSAVAFERITPPWKPNPRLLAKIHFKAPVIDELAREAGIEPEVLEILKAQGLTNAADLKARLALADGSPVTVGDTDAENLAASERIVAGTQDALAGDLVAKVGTAEEEPVRLLDKNSVTDAGDEVQPVGSPPERDHPSHDTRTFVSYIDVRPTDDEPDPDGLGHQRRMKLEASAITLIIEHEPLLARTPLNNPGFDLVEKDSAGNNIRWVEVKAMLGTLKDRPVGMTSTQFRMAQQRGNRYWLYVVEKAASTDPRILRIQNPADRDSTFTFDRGWLSVALQEG